MLTNHQHALIGQTKGTVPNLRSKLSCQQNAERRVGCADFVDLMNYWLVAHIRNTQRWWLEKETDVENLWNIVKVGINGYFLAWRIRHSWKIMSITKTKLSILMTANINEDPCYMFKLNKLVQISPCSVLQGVLLLRQQFIRLLFFFKAEVK